MQIQLDYNFQRVALSNIEIPEIGCFAIEGYNEDGLYYYMVVQTILGESTIATCGPVIPDLDALLGQCFISVEKTEYEERKLAKAVSKFLNDAKKGITNVELINMPKALEQFPDIGSILSRTATDTITTENTTQTKEDITDED